MEKADWMLKPKELEKCRNSFTLLTIQKNTERYAQKKILEYLKIHMSSKNTKRIVSWYMIPLLDYMIKQVEEAHK